MNREITCIGSGERLGLVRRVLLFLFAMELNGYICGILSI